MATFFDVQIISIEKPKLKSVLAKRIATDHKLDIKTANTKLDNLPFTIATAIHKDKVSNLMFEFERLGCRLNKIPSTKKETEKKIEKLTPTKTTNNTQNIKPFIPNDKINPVSFSSSKNTDNTTKTKKKNHKKENLILIFALIIVFGALYFFSQKSSTKTFSNSNNNKTASKNKKAKASNKTNSSSQSSKEKNQDITKSESPVISNKEQEELQQSLPDSLYELFDKTNDLHNKYSNDSKNKNLSKKLSKNYTKLGKSTYSDDAREKFYKFAIAFNPKNDLAWDGLIQTYTNKGKHQEANNTRKQKGKHIKRSAVDIIHSYGQIIGMPLKKRGKLSFTYRTSKRKEEAIKEEIENLANELKSSHSYKIIIITAQSANTKITEKH